MMMTMTMMIVVVIVVLMTMSYILLQVATNPRQTFVKIVILASALGSAPESRRISAGAARSLAHRFDNDDSSNDSKNMVRSNYLKSDSSRLKENNIVIVII